MATAVNMRHKATGLTKTGYVGFSWTTFFWGFLPALFRGDFLTAIVLFLALPIVSALTAGIGGLVILIAWAFMYNKHYTTKLIEKGYEFCDSEETNASAAEAIGYTPPLTS